MAFGAILCAKWPGAEPGTREVYVAFPASRDIRRLIRPPDGWDVEAVLASAATCLAGGPVLVGFDAPIGMPRSLLAALRARGAKADTFAAWLDSVEALDGILEPVAAPGDWKPDRPFFYVQAGPGGLQQFIDEAARQGIEIRRDLEKWTRAHPPLIAGGIPGVAGGSARNVWRDLKGTRGHANAPGIWPFEASLLDPLPPRTVVVAEVYPRLASSIALGAGTPPWPIPTASPGPEEGLARLVGSDWFGRNGVRIEGHSGFEDSRHAFDALISAAALLRLVLEGLPLSDPAREDRQAEGGMLGMGTVLWPAGADLRAPETRENEPVYGGSMDEQALLSRITADARIFGGKPIVRGRRLAVEHVLAMLAAGDTVDSLLQNYPWLERADVQACLLYAKRLVAHERIEPLEVGNRS